MGHNNIIAVLEVLLCSSRSSLQCGNDLRIVTFPVVVGRLILKNEQKAPCDCLAGANRLDQIIIVLLKFPTLIYRSSLK